MSLTKPPAAVTRRTLATLVVVLAVASACGDLDGDVDEWGRERREPRENENEPDENEPDENENEPDENENERDENERDENEDEPDENEPGEQEDSEGGEDSEDGDEGGDGDDGGDEPAGPGTGKCAENPGECEQDS